MRISKTTVAVAGVALMAALTGYGVSAATASAAPASITIPAASMGRDPTSVCVTHGSGAGAAGNVMEYNWDNQPCPKGTYGATFLQSLPSALLLNLGGNVWDCKAITTLTTGYVCTLE